MSSLQELMAFIGSGYVFSKENYPLLAGKSDIQKMAFAINHSILHMNKSIGKIAAECESYDHGHSHLNEDIIKEATVKMLINTLKLADELGMTAKDLFETVPDLMKSKALQSCDCGFSLGMW